MQQTSRRRGLSLLEALLALVLFSTAFVMLLAVFPTAARQVRQGEEILVGSMLASRALEEIRGQAFTEIAPGFTTVEVSSTRAGIPQTTSYAVQTEVSEPSAGLKRIRVMVSWTRDRARYVEMLTDVTQLH